MKRYASVIENRLDGEWYTWESVLEDNAQVLELAQKHNVNYVFIDDKYNIDIDLMEIPVCRMVQNEKDN